MKPNISELDALFAMVGETQQGSSVKQALLVLTPNHRLSRFVHSQYGLYQSARGRAAWPSFPCLSLNNWYQLLWDETRFSAPLEEHAYLQLDKSQEISVWLDVVRNQSEHVELFNARAAAAECRKAWHTLVQWGLAPAGEQWNDDWYASLNIPAEFITWIRAYKSACRRNGLIDFPSMVSALMASLACHTKLFPEKIVLFAFDDINPQFEQICDLAKRRGTHIETFSPSRHAHSVSRLAQSDIDEEIYTAACWASDIVASDSQLRVGIVVPQLAAQRAKVERIFTEVFEPQYVMPHSRRHASGFNISAAIPLASCPPIAAALLALKLNFHELDIEDLSKILHSPFIGTTEELQRRALLASELREQFLHVRVSRFRQMTARFGRQIDTAVQSGTDQLPKEALHDDSIVVLADFYNRLQNLHLRSQGIPRKQRPSEWAGLFAEQLHILGWPGSRSLDTLEFQQIEVWLQTLIKLNEFDYLFPRVTLSECLGFLEQLLVDTPFQAQTYDSSVQVLGVFEAAGMAFDYLWVMNFDSESWPPPTNPSPLMPLALQKRERMPMASVERELALAKQLTKRFKSSAYHVIFSYAESDGDKQQQVSALISDLPAIDVSSLTLQRKSDYLTTIFRHGAIENFDNPSGPAIDRRYDSAGGTQIIKDQAACPFRAFAYHRLRARSAEAPVPGLTAAERGTLIHSALENIWKKIKDQRRLHELDDKALGKKIDDGIRLSFRSLEKSYREQRILGERLKSIEHGRIKKLLRAWFELEKKRAPFAVIFSEKQKTLHIDNLSIRLRYDRIDMLEDGSLFVVDYKTGKLDIRSWVGDRPDEPQVPLYTVAAHENVSGAAFGQINVDQVAYKGISNSADSVPGISSPEVLSRLDLPNTWPEIIAYWQDVIIALGREYIAGDARVKPKHGELTCRYCTLHSLCRVRENASRDNDDEVGRPGEPAGD